MNQMITPNNITHAQDGSQTKPGGVTPGCANIAKDTVFKGEISKCDCMEVRGVVEGIAKVGHVVIHQDGRIEGTLNADSAEIHGTFKGDIHVKGLLKISGSGSVDGKVFYGQLWVEEGAILVADIRKIAIGV